jgi:hypothetical protein
MTASWKRGMTGAPNVVAERRWLLLLHQIPAKPDYLRVKVWRRMQQIGAVTIKNAAWVLPATEAAMEDFQWLMREIAAEGGDALLCEARFLSGLTEQQSAALSRAILADKVVSAGMGVTSAEREHEGPPRGRTWVTRRNVYVDRIASAWLIRRHVDPEARFRFVGPADHVPAEGEIRFDMYEAEYTHVGNSCTFEVLASVFVPGDAAVAAISEIIHDIDLKEVRFGRPETAGVHALLDGIVAMQEADDARLQRGYALFDELYAAFRARPDRRNTA